MPFKKGERLPGQGGRRENAGRKSSREIEIRKTAAVIAREYIEASVKPVMHTYFQLAGGRLVNKWHEGQIVGQEFEADSPTTRHFIDKILPNEQKQENNQPVAIQIIVERDSRNGNGAGYSQDEGQGHGREILIGGD